MTKCSVESCDRVVLARGWCRKHYMRWRTHGSPLLLDRAEEGAPQKFIEMALNHQDKEACLYWPYGRTSKGYAVIGRSTVGSTSVHRRICEVVKGPPPTLEHEACHNCGKGHLGCINPHHLRWDTPEGNSLDRIIHGTDNRGERGGGAKLNWGKVREIKAMKGTMSGPEVAAIYDVRHTTVYSIWNGKAWKEDC